MRTGPVKDGTAERGARVRARRVALGLDTAQLARRVKVTEQTILNWESGRTDLTATYLIRVCKALKMEARDVLEPRIEVEIGAGSGTFLSSYDPHDM